jgi:hypothetical protein
MKLKRLLSLCARFARIALVIGVILWPMVAR